MFVSKAYAISQCDSKWFTVTRHCTYTCISNLLKWFLSSWDYCIFESFSKLLSTQMKWHLTLPEPWNTKHFFKGIMHHLSFQCPTLWVKMKTTISIQTPPHLIQALSPWDFGKQGIKEEIYWPQFPGIKSFMNLKFLLFWHPKFEWIEASFLSVTISYKFGNISFKEWFLFHLSFNTSHGCHPLPQTALSSDKYPNWS